MISKRLIILNVEDNLFIRFGNGFNRKTTNQYAGYVRMDSGKDEETNRFEQFSTLQCYRLPSDVSEKCISTIKRLIMEEDNYEC
jgi:hypothetical protein